MPDPAPFPEGFSVDAVDWLPSGARSGLVRVRGHRPPAVSGPLPELVLQSGESSSRFVSLPDPRADRDPAAWRGAYVLDARPVAEADALWLEWPGGRRLQLPALTVPAHQVDQPPPAEEAAPSADVVDRAVMAERRARKAEAAENAQARIAREALRAVEVLELRANELEQRVAAAEGERDALRSQVASDESEPDVRLEILHAELRELRAALAAAEFVADAPSPVVDTPSPPVAPAVAPIAASEAERRAERLRSALTATVATVAELRLQLHERDVARRTRDVAISAELVRLAVVDRERESRTTELEDARVALREAQTARDEAVAEAAGVRAALEDLQTRHRDVSAELGATRERLASLEAEIESLEREAERTAAQAGDISDLRERLARAESDRDRAETARELAEATALAAAAGRRAAAVAEASAEWVAPATQSAPSISVPAPSVTLRAAAEAQAERAAEQAKPDENVVANLDAARQKLRPTITSPAGQPPADLARGRGGREYPPLRGALVKLAHDDPKAAGLFLAGLLSAQHAALATPPPDYDLTITEVGTFAVSAAGKTTLVSPLAEPRKRGQATFHVTADALTLAETLAGVENRARRFRGPIRVTGKARHARQLGEGRLDVSFADVVRAGADIDPYLVLRALTYAIRPAWTQGQVWSVELDVEGRAMAIAARHSGGLEATDGPHDGEADARVRISEKAFRDLAAGDPAAYATEGDEAVLNRLLRLADRARSGDTA